MKNKVYVGNLSYAVSEEELRETFAKIGNVLSVRIITDSVSGRSKGFGFVEMETEDLAQKAIDELNGTDVQGRTMRVAMARPPRSQGGGGDRRARDSGRGGKRW
jgi:RNA recognition motif-containing protein